MRVASQVYWSPLHWRVWRGERCSCFSTSASIFWVLQRRRPLFSRQPPTQFKATQQPLSYQVARVPSTSGSCNRGVSACSSNFTGFQNHLVSFMFKEVSDAEVVAQDKNRKKELKRVVDDEIFFSSYTNVRRESPAAAFTHQIWCWGLVTWQCHGYFRQVLIHCGQRFWVPS